MSDIIDDTDVDFEHYVTATREIVEEFRDVLARHTAQLQQEAIALGGQPDRRKMPLSYTGCASAATIF